MRLKELIKQTLFKPLDASGLSVFRIFFGIVMLWETARYFQNDWIKGLINLDYHFTYSWFRWVKPVKEEWMVFLFGILAAAAILVTFGLLYEIAAAIIFFIFLYVFLIEPFFVNHFYLIVLLSFLLIFISSNKQYSLDRLIWRKNGDAIIPAWQLFLLQFQVGVVYFYGGIAKINYDWLVYSEPMKHLLAERTDYPLLGSLFKNPWAAYFISWSGLILDLGAPFLLIVRKTRPFMFGCILFFHLINSRLFSIGIFPWLMIAASLLYFPPAWPKQLFHVIKNYRKQGFMIIAGGILFSVITLFLLDGIVVVPFIIAGIGGVVLIWSFFDTYGSERAGSIETKGLTSILQTNSAKTFVIIFVVIWMLTQLLIPLRHYFIPGDSNWTDEGYHFSWRMMLKQRHCRLRFFVYDPVTENKFELERNSISWDACENLASPEMIWQYAKYLKSRLSLLDIESRGMQRDAIERYQILAEARTSLNHRPYLLQIDPAVDLSRQSYSLFRHNSWILLQSDSLRILKPASLP